MGHIIEYTKNRLAQIKANYTTELEKAGRIPHGLSQVSGNELLDSNFTDKELAELDKVVRATLGKDYDILNVSESSLSPCKQSSITYAITHKELFARSKVHYDNKGDIFNSSDFNRIIIRNPEGGYLSTCGYTWLSFQKYSNSDTILYRSNDVETFGIKPKYKKFWRKDGHTYWSYEILFEKYLETCRKGIERVKKRFEKFI